MEAGCPAPTIFSDARDLYVAYWMRNPDFPGWKSGAEPDHPGFKMKTAVLKFRLMTLVRFGYPNEEALRGHPLHRYGLKLYRFHIVENSPLIDEMSSQNKKVFPQAVPTGRIKSSHWIITFHDETLEVVADEASVFSIDESRPPEDALWHVRKTVLPKLEREAEERSFFQSLGSETGGETCDHGGCANRRIEFSVMCRRHHFEMVMKKPCPFD